MKGTTTLLRILLAVLIVGAVNWGLIGFFNYNIIDAILGAGAREETNAAARVVYALVGLVGLAMIYFLPRLTGAPRRPGVAGTRAEVHP